MTNHLKTITLDINIMLRLQIRQGCTVEEDDPTWFSRYVLDFGQLGRELVWIEIDFGKKAPRAGEVWMIEVLSACPIAKKALARARWRVS